ncbi:uncharacterized protein LOC129952030 [Eupeodes corollae]|uniref:uncharacterized protein LOC129952030 n=1 Tax=Eupeodes corollae TaxID=290404 RepID=UPI0024905B45|nr:uncharacterized protein LOC129952030 [Eupeodes corollae]XP_055920427.1 uncharacterized protein LOC129952030 [Eupeodes corollae]
MDVDVSKSLKRCLSVPIINNQLPNQPSSSSSSATSSINNNNQTPKKQILPKQQFPQSTEKMTSTTATSTVPQISNPSSREVSPAPVFNIFAPRARRYSASYSPLGVAAAAAAAAGGATTPVPRLTPRVSQLRQEECADLNSREVNHEREVHSAIQMSQSWEDLTLVTENWSCKSDEMSNPLQVNLPSGISSCSSPSPTSNRAGMRLPYGLSPSPTRRTFSTRRSMSPIAMRPSQLGPVKRKFELDDTSNWNIYSPPPLKKIFTESRGSSPICQSPSSVCPSPDSGTYDGRITPKLFISKLCTNNSTNSTSCSSPMGTSSSSSSGIDAGIDMQSNGSVSSPATNTCSSSESEPMCITPFESVSEETNSAVDVKKVVDNDDATLMDDIKSETSSTSGDSCVSSSGGAEIPKPNFLNKIPTSLGFGSASNNNPVASKAAGQMQMNDVSSSTTSIIQQSNTGSII